MTTADVRPPSDPVATPPARRPGSVRRTSTVIMSWPKGLGASLQLKGRARDLLTPLGEEPPVVLRESRLEAWTGRQRDIESISAEPPVEGLESLVGCRAGGSGNLRLAIEQQLGPEVEAGTPLHLLLDDMAGTTLISGFTFLRWRSEIPGLEESMRKAPRRVMRDICSGFRDGSSSLDPDGSVSARPQNVAPAPLLEGDQDPWSWHERDDHPPMAMRRARRIDVRYEGDAIDVDAMFRDSCWDPDGSEIVVHEYELFAQVDTSSATLKSIEARPRVLPYVECPLAAPNADWLVGLEMRTLRREVLALLRGTDCCTHLNDALRSLAEVPVLATYLAQQDH